MQIDSEALDKANLKALQDDYTKFIRWAQWRIDKNGKASLATLSTIIFLMHLQLVACAKLIKQF